MSFFVGLPEVVAKDIAYLYASVVKQVDKPDQKFTMFELHKDNEIHTVNFDGYYVFDKTPKGISQARLETDAAKIFNIKKQANTFIVESLDDSKTIKDLAFKYEPAVFYLPSDLQGFFESDSASLRFSQYMPRSGRVMPMDISLMGTEKLSIKGKAFETKAYDIAIYFSWKDKALKKLFSWFKFKIWWDPASKRVIKMQYNLSDTVEVITEFDRILSPKSGIEILNNGNADVSLQFKQLNRAKRKKSARN